MGWARAALGLVAILAAGALLVSGGSGADPRTPRGLAGMPPPFLGTTVVGDGGLTAAIDAYGDVVDLRAPGPAGPALIDNPAERQAAGTVPADTGIVPWVSVGGGPARPMWTADSITQSYRPGTNVVVSIGRFGKARVRIVYAAGVSLLACLAESDERVRVQLRTDDPTAMRRLRCDDRLARETVRTAERDDRRWLGRSRPLGPGAPAWAERMYNRSLLVLHALTDRRTGAVAAGARDGWAYVWPRDAGVAALALEAAGYRAEARQVTRFLLGLDLNAASRFSGDGKPIAGRGPQGDAAGWIAIAARALKRSGGGLAGRLPGGSAETSPGSPPDLPDYQEKGDGDYLGNAIASDATTNQFATRLGLVRIAGDSGSGLDSAAAWAVEPFELRRLYPLARRTMLRLAQRSGRFGIAPGEGWPGRDPWTAPTAWTAWSLAALGDRQQALRLLADLRRAATPAGTLPERVDVRTGVPRSTTPLAWSHAFAILALQELWPGRTASTFPPSR